MKTRLVCAALLLLACDPDPGADAGPREDATAGADSGSSDAGTRDAGRTDAGAPDAGANEDAGTEDAGLARDPLAGRGTVEEVMGGFSFLEGPHWIAADSVLRFTDIPANTIFELTPPATLGTFRNPSDNANGLATLPDGRMLAAEHGARRVSVTESNGSVADFATTYQGQRFNSPNDIAVRSDGVVYFTDPPYGLGGRTREIDFNGLYRVSAGVVTAEWEGAPSTRPNGVSLSPDESVLYLADTDAGTVTAFAVGSDGALTNERAFATGLVGADGMAVDAEGNLFVTHGGGVEVLAPDGSVWGRIDVNQVPANCAFGGDDGRTLYITARTSLYEVRLTIPGA